jgi:xanthine permease XanP
MFGTVAVAGIKILAEAGLHRRNMLIVAISLGMGLGVAAVPEVLRELPRRCTTSSNRPSPSVRCALSC